MPSTSSAIAVLLFAVSLFGPALLLVAGVVFNAMTAAKK